MHFINETEEILSLKINHKAGSNGGYASNGSVIYTEHPSACPSVLVDKNADAVVTYMSNGSLDFKYKYPKDGFEVQILRSSFDQFEKREIGVASNNIWLKDQNSSFATSIINPALTGVTPVSLKIVKDLTNRAFWYCHTFNICNNLTIETAVKYSMVICDAGPAIIRQCFIRNTGSQAFSGSLFGFFDIRGTQLFNYNKEIWYDSGMPVSFTDTICSALLPYSSKIQIKRISSSVQGGLTPVSSTCDYLNFVGRTNSTSLFPQALMEGNLRDSRKVLNRFSTPSVHATQYNVNLAPGEYGTVSTSLLYIADDKVAEIFRNTAQSDMPDYNTISEAYLTASDNLIKSTPDSPALVEIQNRNNGKGKEHPSFRFTLPEQTLLEKYVNSLWGGVDELYENCRAHGERLAEGIELGTRDRAQDMYSKMKEAPEIVRDDLVHLFSFMYELDVDFDSSEGAMTLQQKLHGMFPRQYPSRWTDRSREVMNDNRHYSDSALWPLDSIVKYISETGDYEILKETVKTVTLTNPDNPVVSGIVGTENTYSIIEIIFATFASFQRHVQDSPYGMAQILYGGWCDPIDMFGTSEVGNPDTRGKGRGTCASLSMHLFMNLVSIIDIINIKNIRESLDIPVQKIIELKHFTDDLRQNIIKTAWEEKCELKGFAEYIHEFNADASVPDYSAGEKGYTLGSMQDKDFDGVNRRLLAAQAWGLAMISIERDYLIPVQNNSAMTEEIINTVNDLFYDENIGLSLLSKPVANSRKSLDYVGRMGIIPSGTAENGEYHHGQAIMAYFALTTLGNEYIDKAWQHFTPIFSVMRNCSLNGPFEAPATSYASDPDDPHFGAGMYFGLSGSMNWIIDTFERIAGVKLNLHDPDTPDIEIQPVLPSLFGGKLKFERIIHYCKNGVIRKIPFTLSIELENTDIRNNTILINGEKAKVPAISSLDTFEKVEIEIK